MQLKLVRSQKKSLVTQAVIFCIDARAAFTPEEQSNINRYRLGGQVIYTSEARQRADESRMAAYGNSQARHVEYGSVEGFLSSAGGKIGHGLKAAAFGAIGAMRLRITIASLHSGRHIECKNLDELMGAVDAIMDACTNLKGYLQAAAEFNGSEILIDFTGDEPQVIAQTTTPDSQLIAPDHLAGEPQEQLEWQPAPYGSMYNSSQNLGMYELGKRFKNIPAQQWYLVAGLIVIAIVVIVWLMDLASPVTPV